MDSAEEVMCEVDLDMDMVEEKFNSIKEELAEEEEEDNPRELNAEAEACEQVETKSVVVPMTTTTSAPNSSKSVRAAMRKARRPTKKLAEAEAVAPKVKTFWCFGAPVQKGCELCFGCCMPLECKKCRVEKEACGAVTGYVCRLCEARMPDADLFRAHMKSAHVDLECKECGKAFPNTTRLKNHAKIHVAAKRYLCEKCSSSFRRLDQYKTHCIRKHTDTKAFVCRECGKTWKTKGDLMQHMRSHRRASAGGAGRGRGGATPRPPSE